MAKKLIAISLTLMMLLGNVVTVLADTGTEEQFPVAGQTSETTIEIPSQETIEPQQQPVLAQPEEETPDEPQTPATGSVAMDAPVPYADDNLLTNGGFEIDGSGTFGLLDWSIWDPGASKDWSWALDTDEYTEGTRSLRLTSNHLVDTKFCPQIAFPYEVGKTYIVSADIKTENVVANSPTWGGLIFRVQTAGVSGYPATPAITGTQDWTTYTLPVTVPAGTTKMTAEFLIERMTGTVWIDNVRVVEAYSLSIAGVPSDVMEPGDTAQLTLENSAGLTGLTAEWSSSNEAVATVTQDGLVTAVKNGSTTITARVDEYHFATAEVFVGEVRYANRAANPGFEETETVTETEVATNWRLWQDDIKATNWTYQRYAGTTNGWKDVPDDALRASFDTTSFTEGSQSVKLEVLDAGRTNQQAIFKQDKIYADGNMLTKFAFWYKSQNLGGSVTVRTEEYNAANTMINRSTRATLPAGTQSEWTQASVEFTTLEATEYIMVVVIIGNYTGTLWLDDVWVGQPYIEVTEIQLGEDEYDLLLDGTLPIDATVLPETASFKTLNWTSSNEAIATVDENGIVTGHALGDVVITATSESDPDITASCTVHVVDSIFKVLEGDMSLRNGEKRYLTYVDSHEAEDETRPVSWASSDEDVVTIEDESLLVTQGPGSATVTLTSADGARTTDIEITVNSDDNDYTLMKARWLGRITGGDDMNLADAEILQYVQNLSASADTLWESMDRSEDRSRMWPQASGSTASADMTTQFNNLRTLTQAFATEGANLYGQREVYEEIVLGIEFLIAKGYNGTYYVNNWWDWQIGSAQAFADILMILDDYLDGEQTTNWAGILVKYVPDPTKQLIISNNSYTTATGANRTDLGLVVLATGILLRNDARIKMIPDNVTSLLVVNSNASTKNGIYADGSFIDHSHHAYTGSYGNELMKGLGRLMSVLADTNHDFDSSQAGPFYDAILMAYLPTMYEGRMVSAVNGRSIARYQTSGQELSSGNATIANLLALAKYAPEDFRDTVYSSAKYWMLSADEEFGYYNRARDLEALLNYKAVLEDDSIVAKKPFSGAHVYGMMDRVVQNNGSYNAVLSMHSSRVGTYESLNRENMNGWHTGSGMLYVYNSDYAQFGIGYWPTVDPYRLPGTTVDTRTITNTSSTNANGESKTSSQAWAGGATDGAIAAVGMQYNAADVAGFGSNVNAKKSWFLLDGAIVALGTDINGSTAASIETVVDNRQLTNGGDNLVLLNGTAYDGTALSETLSAGSWVHMAGTTAGSSMGYVFPEDTAMLLEKEWRSGTYIDINPSQSNTTSFTERYLKMSVNHGTTAANDSYYYVILPGANAADTASYAAANSLVVIQNDATAQALRDLQAGLLAVNVWDTTGATLEGFAVDKAASILMRQNASSVTLTLSDPTQKGGTITLVLDDEIASITSKSDAITVGGDNKTLTFNTAGAGGASFQITYELAGVPLTGIKVSPASITLEEGMSSNLQVALQPANATDAGTATWESDNKAIATVDANGVVTAVAPGTANITATVGSFSDSSLVTVTATTVTGLTIASPPTKTEYWVGDTFDDTGLVVEATYTSGITKPVTGYKLTGFDSTAAGEKTITATFEGKTASFKVYVKDPALTGITITKAPAKLQYKVGEALDLAGLEVTATWENGKTEAITGYTVSGFDSATPGSKTLTISYLGHRATLQVLVVEKDKVQYKMTGGDGNVWAGGSEGLRFVAEAELALFQNVLVNGEALRRGVDYTAESGSTIITLLPAYLKTLADNTYTIELQFADGSAVGTFIVKDSSTPGGGSGSGGSSGSGSAATGDGSNLPLWLALAFAALCGLGATLALRAKKRRSPS